MLFKKELCDLILAEKKTQTRRLVKPLDYVSVDGFSEVLDANYQVRWRWGKDYAIQPGRGKKQVGRIRITDIRCEKLQSISYEDVIAEGVDFEGHSLQVAHYNFARLWDSINKKGNQWADDPKVWVLTFELVN